MPTRTPFVIECEVDPRPHGRCFVGVGDHGLARKWRTGNWLLGTVTGVADHVSRSLLASGAFWHSPKLVLSGKDNQRGCAFMMFRQLYLRELLRFAGSPPRDSSYAALMAKHVAGISEWRALRAFLAMPRLRSKDALATATWVRDNAPQIAAALLSSMPRQTQTNPPMAKCHSQKAANEFLRLGWTLKNEHRVAGYDEPAEYFFVWEGPGEPLRPSKDPNDWGR